MAKRSTQELEDLVADTEALLDALDPSQTPASDINDTTDLQAIGLAMDEIDRADASLRTSVARARSRGRSWTEIALVLGVSRQAARQRFIDVDGLKAGTHGSLGRASR